MVIRKLFVIVLPLLFATSGVWAATIKSPLQKFTAQPSLELRCINGSQSISIPAPERWDIHAAVLTLHYTVSNNLIGEVSQLMVAVNDQPIAQTKLNPQAPNVEVSIEIPAALLKPGYNTLTFRAAQHYSRQQCEPPCSPDLWTNISVTESYLQYDYDLKPIPLQLGAGTAMIFDPTQFPESEVHVATENLTADMATLASIVASGVARQFDYRKVKFSISRDIKPGVDNILVGSTAFANKVLAAGKVSVSQGNGGLLKILHLPKQDGGWDTLHALLVLSDDKPAALRIVAETLANMSLPYPDSDELRALSFSVPDVSMYSGRHVLASDKPYDFKTLNLPTHSFRGLTSGSSELTFRLPADFLIKQNHYAKLALSFSYGAGMKNDSSLNVAVNGKELRAIHLDSVAGNFIDGYKIDIPTYVFKPGTNTISFSPGLHAAGTLCDLQQFEGMFLTIYETSTLYFPPMPHFVELPKIELFTLNGFPFTRWPDGYQTLVYLPQADDTSLATALDLVGMITQRNGFPLFGTQVSYTEPKAWDGEILVVGKAASVPKNYMEAAPLKLLDTSSVPYPTVRSWNAEASVAFSKQKSELGEGVGVVMEFESPYKQGRSVIVLTSQSNRGLETLGDAILDSGVQAGINGDLAFINLANPKYPVTSLRVGKKYTTGNKGNISIVDSFLYANSYAFYGSIAAALLGLAGIGYWRLRVFRAKRAGGTGGNVPK